MQSIIHAGFAITLDGRGDRALVYVTDNATSRRVGTRVGEDWIVRFQRLNRQQILTLFS